MLNALARTQIQVAERSRSQRQSLAQPPVGIATDLFPNWMSDREFAATQRVKSK
jgi:hypothetical protein